MLDGNACAARCWEGRARQRLNIAVENAYAAHSRQPPFLDGFFKQALPCHGAQGARLVYIIDTFVAARHRRENKCL